ncbi:MAG: hypothetical protein AAF399_29740, partial [Bacteroidota bacterium]
MSSLLPVSLSTWLGFFLFWIATVFPSICVSQSDSTYIERLPHWKNLAVHTTLNRFQLRLTSPDGSQQTFQNYHLGLGVRVKYKKIGLSLSVPIVHFQRTISERPLHVNLGFQLLPRQWFLMGGIRLIRGFESPASGGSPALFHPLDQMIHVHLTSHYLL